MGHKLLALIGREASTTAFAAEGLGFIELHGGLVEVGDGRLGRRSAWQSRQ
jgi:hypothetical protein